jgi:hypothetical protein
MIEDDGNYGLGKRWRMSNDRLSSGKDDGDMIVDMKVGIIDKLFYLLKIKK